MRPVAVIGIRKDAVWSVSRPRPPLAGGRSGQESACKTRDLSPVRSKHSTSATSPDRRLSGQSHLAPYIAGPMGITGVPCTRIEAACASSGSAFFHAFSAVAAGLYDVVLVTGVEKMTSQQTPRVAEILAMAGECCTRRQGRRDLSRSVRHDRAAAHAPVRHHAGASGRGSGEESRQRREESRRAHEESDHARAGDGRQADRRPADRLRLLAGQRWRGVGRDRAARSGSRIHGQAGPGARDRADFRLRGARPESRYHRLRRP